MSLRKFSKKDNRGTRRRNLEIKDFIWVDVEKLHIPWWPICEIDSKKNKNREMCAVTPLLMKDKNGRFNTLLEHSVHVDMLNLYERYGEHIFAAERLKGTRYYLLHKTYREQGIETYRKKGIENEVEWICYKMRRLTALFEDIKKNGYRYMAENKLAVLDKPMASYYGYKRDIEGYELWNGTHRAACLYKLGYKRVKALLLGLTKTK